MRWGELIGDSAVVAYVPASWDQNKCGNVDLSMLAVEQILLSTLFTSHS